MSNITKKLLGELDTAITPSLEPKKIDTFHELVKDVEPDMAITWVLRWGTQGLWVLPEFPC